VKRFIQRENLRLLRERLTRTNDETKCRRIVKLIEEEEVKGRASIGIRAQRQVSVTLGNAPKVA
jgi:alpha-D-ribose 1-methylphosphonate 5-triphosphate synthase subunit PhnL